MKKLILFTIILSLAFISCKSKKQVVLIGLTDTAFLKEVRCNLRTPGWGTSLGIVSFATDSTWTISNDTITQIWSDAVTASNCQKTKFNGERSQNSFNADCRSNPDRKGDLFSWCAVVRFQDTLCPYPWRVPTAQDFIDLDIALGSDGGYHVSRTLDSLENLLVSYFIWGGEPSGGCYLHGTMKHQGSVAFYWSQSKFRAYNTDTSHGLALQFGFCTSNKEWFTGPQDGKWKGSGVSLRCVR
jgi:uncharacterized protein (TIGR02145 family)